MKKNIWDVRIPNFAAFLLLLVSIGVTVFLIRDRITITGRASNYTIPQSITVSNITDASFTVSFTTRDQSRGAVNLENTSSLETLFLDSRESDNQKEFTTHSITVNNLQANTDYEFSVLSNDQKYTDNGQPFKIKTASSDSGESQNTKTALGTITTEAGDHASGAIVYLKADNSQTLSALTQQDGTFRIPLNTLRNSLLTSFQSLADNDIITLTVEYQSQKSDVLVFYEYIDQIPNITISENYDFTNTIREESESTQSALLIPTETRTQTTNSVRISNPPANTTITDSRPQIRGSAAPNQAIALTITPDDISTVVAVSTTGTWSFRPSTALSQGNHTVTIKAKDSSGLTRTVSTSFNILPSGSQIADSATPSASPSITRTPSPTAGLSPTISLSISPTAVLTMTVTPTTTLTPTVTRVLTPTPTVPVKVIPSVEPPGASSSLVLTGISLFFIVTGAVLFFIIS